MRERAALLGVALWFSMVLAAEAAPDFAALKIQPYEPRKPAPEFELQNLDGKKVRLTDYRGKVVLLFFYTTW